MNSLLIAVLAFFGGYCLAKLQNKSQNCQVCPEIDNQEPEKKGIEAVKDIIKELKPRRLGIIPSNKEQIRIKQQLTEEIINPEEIPKDYDK